MFSLPNHVLNKIRSCSEGAVESEHFPGVSYGYDFRLPRSFDRLDNLFLRVQSDQFVGVEIYLNHRTSSVLSPDQWWFVSVFSSYGKNLPFVNGEVFVSQAPYTPIMVRVLYREKQKYLPGLYVAGGFVPHDARYVDQRPSFKLVKDYTPSTKESTVEYRDGYLVVDPSAYVGNQGVYYLTHTTKATPGKDVCLFEIPQVPKTKITAKYKSLTPVRATLHHHTILSTVELPPNDGKEVEISFFKSPTGEAVDLEPMRACFNSLEIDLSFDHNDPDVEIKLSVDYAGAQHPAEIGDKSIPLADGKTLLYQKGMISVE